MIASKAADDRNLIDHIARVSSGKNAIYRGNVSIFLHFPPNYMKHTSDVNLDEINIYGNYSSHPASFLSDVKFMHGDITAKPIENTPVTIPILGYRPTLKMTPSKGSSSIQIIKSDFDIERDQKMSELEKKLSN